MLMSFLLIVNVSNASQFSDNRWAEWQVTHCLCKQATDNNRPEFAYYIGKSILGDDWQNIITVYRQAVFSELSQDDLMAKGIPENEEQCLAQKRVLYDLLDRSDDDDDDKPVGVDEFVVNGIFNLVDNTNKG